jgi:hypothetical protein
MASFQHLILYIIYDNKGLQFFFNLFKDMQLRHVTQNTVIYVIDCVRFLPSYYPQRRIRISLG